MLLQGSTALDEKPAAPAVTEKTGPSPFTKAGPLPMTERQKETIAEYTAMGIVPLGDAAFEGWMWAKDAEGGQWKFNTQTGEAIALGITGSRPITLDQMRAARAREDAALRQRGIPSSAAAGEAMPASAEAATVMEGLPSAEGETLPPVEGAKPNQSEIESDVDVDWTQGTVDKEPPAEQPPVEQPPMIPEDLQALLSTHALWGLVSRAAFAVLTAAIKAHSPAQAADAPQAPPPVSTEPSQPIRQRAARPVAEAGPVLTAASLDNGENWSDVRLARVGLSPGSQTLLDQRGIQTMGQLSAHLEVSRGKLTTLPGVGPKKEAEILACYHAFFGTPRTEPVTSAEPSTGEQ